MGSVIGQIELRPGIRSDRSHQTESASALVMVHGYSSSPKRSDWSRAGSSSRRVPRHAGQVILHSANRDSSSIAIALSQGQQLYRKLGVTNRRDLVDGLANSAARSAIHGEPGSVAHPITTLDNNCSVPWTWHLSLHLNRCIGAIAGRRPLSPTIQPLSLQSPLIHASTRDAEWCPEVL
jgi:hypothetical protein